MTDQYRWVLIVISLVFAGFGVASFISGGGPGWLITVLGWTGYASWGAARLRGSGIFDLVGFIFGLGALSLGLAKAVGWMELSGGFGQQVADTAIGGLDCVFSGYYLFRRWRPKTGSA